MNDSKMQTSASAAEIFKVFLLILPHTLKLMLTITLLLKNIKLRTFFQINRPSSRQVIHFEDLGIYNKQAHKETNYPNENI